MSRKSRDPLSFSVTDADGESYHISAIPFGSSKSIELLPDVLDLISPIMNVTSLLSSLAPFMAGEGFTAENIGELEIDGKVLAEIVREFSKALRDQGGSRILRNILANCSLDKGSPVMGSLSDLAVFDQVFQGNIMLMIQVLIPVVQMNWLSFLKK